MPRNAAQTRPSRGMATPRRRLTASRSRAARPTRSATMVKGGSSRTARAVKKNEPPQSTDRASSMAHSSGPMLRLIPKAGIA